MMARTASLVSALLLLGQAAATLPPIIVKGSKFYFQNGTQFFIKGVAYQQGVGAAGAATTTGSDSTTSFIDPLSNPTLCQRDVPILKNLGVNAIRTYAIDPTADHDSCMSLLDSAGIYVISDLSQPSQSINRDDPSWDTALYTRYTSVVDVMSKYSNVIGFFAGNEVTNNASNTAASAFVKAAVRDTKAYIKANVNRWMGVGYAANDDANIRFNIAPYFNCADQGAAIDYWGYNIYEWCGDKTIQSSGYQTQIDFFKNFSVPVFFAEYGCNTVGGAEGRIWEETTALYSDAMTGDISGGIVYMYFEEANDYGLVKIVGGEASTMKNYGALKTKLASAHPSGTAMSAYNPTNSPQPCPSLSSDWVARGDVLPPSPNATLCNCMHTSLSCTVASNLDITDYGDLFGSVCGLSKSACAGISKNVTTGVYGPYSMCNATEQLGYVLDAYYKSLGSNSNDCNWGGKAVLKTPQQGGGNCAAALSSASSAVSVAATATGGTASSSSFAVPVPMKNVLTIGDLAIGLYVLVAMGVGASMVLL